MSGTHPTDTEPAPGADPHAAGSPHVTAPERPSSRPPGPRRELQTGDFVAEYRLITPIGAGGMGKVFLADDERLARKVALKVLPPEDSDEEGRARFLREARALARVDHPSVVHVFASGVDGDIAWMALEYIEGDPLCDVLGDGALDEETALSLCAQVARGLAAVHAEGVVHRDIKPDNLLLDDDGVLRIVDLGVALISEPGGTGGFTTRTGVAVGTPHYMAPEQARGGKVDERADVWALGATLWALLTGKPPFWHDDDETDLDILSRVLREPIVDVRTRALVSQGTAELLHALLTRAPEDRPSDLGTIAEALEGLADDAMERADRGEDLDAEFEPIPPDAVPELDEAMGGDDEDDDDDEMAADAARLPPAARERPTKDDLPAQGADPAPPGVWLARGVVLLALALLLAGAVATVVRLATVEAAPTPPTGAPPTTSPNGPAGTGTAADPGELVLPARTPARPDAGAVPADAGDVVAAPVVTAEELAARLNTGGPEGDDAARELVTRADPAAVALLVELVKDPGVTGGRVLAAVLASGAAHNMPVFEAALFAATPTRQLQAVNALERMRNVASLNLLQKASREHNDARIRAAAKQASRSIFSVEGDED